MKPLQKSKSSAKRTLHEEKIWEHLQKFSFLYFPLLLITTLTIPLLRNYLLGKPLLMGPESYYWLSLAQTTTLTFQPFLLLLKIIPDYLLFLLSPILSLFSLFLFLILSKKKSWNYRITFPFLFFLIISPSFIFAAVTLSAYLFCLFLLLIGFSFLSSNKKWVKIIVVLPFLFLTTFDLLTTILTILLLLLWIKEEKKHLFLLIPGLMLCSQLLQSFFLSAHFILGPFAFTSRIPALLSDLGGVSGLGFSLVLLAFLGLGTSWPRKKWFSSYLFLLLLGGAFIYNNQALFYLNLIIIFFAATAFRWLLAHQWTHETLRSFTLLLIFLSLVFSTLAYLDRINLEVGPFAPEKEILTEIKEQIRPTQIIFSSPENSYYIRYFAEREPFLSPHLDSLNSPKSKIADEIFASTYITATFPILKKNELSWFYFTPKMKEIYPAEQGLFFLLRNERFKLIRSSEDYEAWMWKEEGE